MVHGDDFTALGTRHGLDLYEAGMKSAFDVKLRGRIGTLPGDIKELKIMNRILRLNDGGSSYDADTRRVELLS